MNIVYLANIRFPSERAHTIQISHMCDAFVAQGVETILYVNKRQPDENSFSVQEIHYKVTRLSHGFFFPRIKAAYYLSELFFSCSFLRLGDTNATHIFSRHEWVIWFLSIFISTKKLVWESHEAKYNFPARRLLKKNIKTIVISEGIFDAYTSLGVPASHMLVAHDAIDQTFFQPVETKEVARARLGLLPEEKVIMYIGGFDAWKGTETFFASAKFVHNVRFVVIGGTKKEVQLFSIKYPDVTFLGQHPYHELKDNQQAADVLVVPNSGQNDLSLKYTSPLKLFAHLASGVPLVISDIPSLVTVAGRDLVTTVVPDSPQALAEGIENVFADYDGKKRSAQALKEQAIRYTWDKRAEAIITFISNE